MNRTIYTDSEKNAIRYSQFRSVEQEIPFTGVGVKFVASGEEQYIANGRKYVVREGEYLIGNDFTSAVVKINHATPVQGICIDISSGIIAEVADYHDLSMVDVKEFLLSNQFLVNRYHFSNTQVGSMLQHIRNNIKTGFIHADVQRQELFYNLAEALISDQRFVFHHLRKMDFRKPCTNEDVFRVLLQVRLFLEEHVTERVSLDDLALKAGISKYHLIRSFKKTFGVSPYRYQLRKRLELAWLDLNNGSCISDVAFRCGYPDVSSFTKAFRLLFGQTPGSVKNEQFLTTDVRAR